MRERFSLTFTPGEADIDELGHVNNAVFVRWIQEIATAHWRELALPEDDAAYVWVVTRHEIDYRRITPPGETLVGETWVGTPAGARFDRHVRFTGAAGDTRVDARTVWALIDRATWRARRVPPDLVARLMR